MAKAIIIDDSRMMSSLVKDFLGKLGHEVVGMASDGNIGVDLYKETKPDFVLLDLTMPNCDGYDCLCQILDFDATAKVLVISAVQNEDKIQQCLKRGAKAFINKPLRFREQDFCNNFKKKLDDAIAA